MLAFGRNAPVPGWYWNCWLSLGIAPHVALVTAEGHCAPPWRRISKHVSVVVVIRPVVRSCVTSCAVAPAPGVPSPPAQGAKTPPLAMQSVVELSCSCPPGSFSHSVNAAGASQGVETTWSPATGAPVPQVATALPPDARPSSSKLSYWTPPSVVTRAAQPLVGTLP